MIRRWIRRVAVAIGVTVMMITNHTATEESPLSERRLRITISGDKLVGRIRMLTTTWVDVAA
jgi:hypothetical protein